MLDKVQSKTKVLVHLSNLHGGQIPGKIYHYSATNKPILFILDGTEEEQILLMEYFQKYNRYYFCKNTVESILDELNVIQKDIETGKMWTAVNEFSPKKVVTSLL